MGWLNEDVALITGGGSGLGRALVSRFLEEGAKVAVLETSEQKAEALRNALPEVEVIAGDVRSLPDNERAVRRAVDRFGKLDIFIGNAGILDRVTSLLDMPADRLSDAFDEVMGVNVKGYILGARAAIPELKKTRGAIVFTASSAAFIPGGGGIFYTASKHAVVGIVRQLAFELAPDIRVNGVGPGPMRTDMRGSVVLDAHHPSKLQESDWAVLEKAFPLPHSDPAAYTGIFVALASRRNAATTTGEVINAADGIAIRGHFPPGAAEAVDRR